MILKELWNREIVTKKNINNKINWKQIIKSCKENQNNYKKNYLK